VEELRGVQKNFIQKSSKKVSLGRKNADKRISQGITGRLGRSERVKLL
jgi:hypothetical protein